MWPLQLRRQNTIIVCLLSLYVSSQAEKEEQATKEITPAPLKPDAGEFAPQPAEVWGNEIVAPDTGTMRNWADDTPGPAPVAGVGAAPA